MGDEEEDEDEVHVSGAPMAASDARYLPASCLPPAVSTTADVPIEDHKRKDMLKANLLSSRERVRDLLCPVAQLPMIYADAFRDSTGGRRGRPDEITRTVFDNQQLQNAQLLIHQLPKRNELTASRVLKLSRDKPSSSLLRRCLQVSR